MATQSYSQETKAAILAALMEGQSPSALHREYGIPRGTIASWKVRLSDPFLHQGRPVFLTDAPVATAKKTERIPELVLDLMIARLESQIALAQHCADQQWLRSQGADSLAILLGVLDDKLYRMLEALERARSRHSIAEGE